MPTNQTAPQFEHRQHAAVGVLVVNLGTPDAPTPPAVRRFLRQFLSDPRVIEKPRVLWWLILNLVILVIRPRRSAAAYKKIWTDRGSPLLIHSEAIANKLRAELKQRQFDDDPIHVELAMTYGSPSIDDAIDKLVSNGVSRILTLPLYPQYSATTTAAVFDAVNRKLAQLRRVPETRFAHHYFDQPGYISALAASVADHWASNGRGEKLLMSFHGVPERTRQAGDPYHDQCQATASLLAQRLDLAEGDWSVSFQSRVGTEEWLSPYTDQTVKSYADNGVRRFDIVCPGFAADCLETLEEIAMQNSEAFIAAGGESLNYIPALNAADDHIACLADIVMHHIDGWGTNNSNIPAHESSAHAAIGAVQ